MGIDAIFLQVGVVLAETEIEVLGILVDLEGQILGIEYLPRILRRAVEGHVEHGVQRLGAADELEVPVFLHLQAAALAERRPRVFVRIVTGSAANPALDGQTHRMALSDGERQPRAGIEDHHGIEDGFRLRFLFRLSVLLTILLAFSLLVIRALVRGLSSGLGLRLVSFLLFVLIGLDGFIEREEAELQQGGSVEIDLGLVFLGLFLLLFRVQFHHGHGNEVVVQVRLVVALLDEILEIALRERGHEVRHIFLHISREIGIETGDQGEDLVVPHV